jgi:hypothetical protein
MIKTLKPSTSHLLPQVLASAFLALALGLQGCGGGSSKQAAIDPTPLAGVWTSVPQQGATNSVTGLIMGDGSGAIRFMDQNWVQVAGVISRNGNALSGDGIMYNSQLQTPEQDTFTGAMGGGIMYLTTTSGGTSDTVPFQPNATYNVPVQLSALYGSYTAASSATSMGVASTMTIDANGGMEVNTQGVTDPGTLVQPTPDVNAFTCTLSVAAGGSNAPVNYQGLAFYGPTARTLTVMLSTNNPPSGMSSELSAVFSMQ